MGQTIESGIAGAVLGATLWAPRLRGVVVKVVAFVVLCAVATIVLQLTGLAPAIAVNRDGSL